MGPEARIPRAEGCLPFAIQHARANLQQEMGAALAPSHLLLFHHPFADHLVHGRFDEARADALPLAIAFAVVRNEVSNRAASSKYTLFELLVGCKPPRWLESMVPERANSVLTVRPFLRRFSRSGAKPCIEL